MALPEQVGEMFICRQQEEDLSKPWIMCLGFFTKEHASSYVLAFLQTSEVLMEREHQKLLI